MGRLVNKFKPSGSGMPNDVNAARSFLEKTIENILELLVPTEVLFS